MRRISFPFQILMGSINMAFASYLYATETYFFPLLEVLGNRPVWSEYFPGLLNSYKDLVGLHVARLLVGSLLIWLLFLLCFFCLLRVFPSLTQMLFRCGLRPWQISPDIFHCNPWPTLKVSLIRLLDPHICHQDELRCM